MWTGELCSWATLRTRSFLSLARESIVDSKTALIWSNCWISTAQIGRGYFTEFEEVRKVNTDAIADMAIENFIEMRDRVADPRFLFQQESRAGPGGAVSAAFSFRSMPW